jgi:hypothetical protein
VNNAYIDREMLVVSFVRMVLMACGKKEKVVQAAARRPIMVIKVTADFFTIYGFNKGLINIGIPHKFYNLVYMNKRAIIPFIALLGISVFLISWGVTGHRTIGRIAENHLSPSARAAVNELLGSASLADVSTWADEVRNQPEYRHTSSWHFLNLPLGLNYAQFEQQVARMTGDNVYSALLNQEHILGDKSTSKDQKTEALKFIVHFVGDLHQPMHISRAEDKGGNTIQLNYGGEGTNLHSLWDTKLLEHQGLTYEQLAEKYDHASPAQIRQWQSDPLMKWIWESYEISSRLYAEIDAMKGRSIDDSYYQSHISIIQERIGQAGIRLAGLLNQIFQNGLPASAASSTPPVSKTPVAAIAIDIRDAASHVDQQVRLCAKVYGFKVLDGMTLVNLGAAYPDQLLTLVLRGQARDGYTVVDSQTICVTGKIENYKGKPEIVVTDPRQIAGQGQ